MFGQDFDVKVWSKDFEFWNLIKICVRTAYSAYSAYFAYFAYFVYVAHFAYSAYSAGFDIPKRC